MKRLWLIQAVGNALLFWCAFTWLGIRDARSGQLVATAVFGLLIATSWLWLQNGMFVYCGDRSQGIWPAYRKGLRTLALFSVLAISFVVLYWAIGKLEGPLTTAGQRTASWLTFYLRRPVKPATCVRVYLAVLWGFRWIVVPAVMLPVAAGAARSGLKGLWRGGSKVFWLEYLVALVLGFYIPSLLMGRIPKLSGTAAQILSFVVRFGVAYVLMVTAWLAVAFFSARGQGDAR